MEMMSSRMQRPARSFGVAQQCAAAILIVLLSACVPSPKTTSDLQSGGVADHRKKEVQQLVDCLVTPSTEAQKEAYTDAASQLYTLESPDDIRAIISMFDDSRPTPLTMEILSRDGFTVGDSLFYGLQHRIAERKYKAFYCPEYISTKKALTEWAKSNSYDIKAMREQYARDHQAWRASRGLKDE